MVVDTTLYDILGVNPNASYKELKEAFLKKARKLYPRDDLNGTQSSEEFEELNRIYKFIKDERKRKLYDEVGIKAYNDYKEGRRLNYGGTPLYEYAPPPPKSEDIIYTKEVTLEDLYNGSQLKLRITRNILCTECKGTGRKPGKYPSECEECEGTGRNKRSCIYDDPCPKCNGYGYIIDQVDQCQLCHGSKTMQEKRIVEVKIEPGMKDGEKILFPGLSDEYPDVKTADFIVVLKLRPNSTFSVKNNDLYTEKVISLSEAMLGFRFPLKHLDGRNLIVEYKNGDVIQPGDVKMIEGEGMPVRSNPSVKGNLYIKFKVNLPKKEEMSEKLRVALMESSRNDVNDDEKAENDVKVFLKDIK